MASGFPGSPFLLKGAFIQFPIGTALPIPDIIAFQYNPESMKRDLHPWKPLDEDTGSVTSAAQGDAAAAAKDKANPVAQPFDPIETMTMAIELDAADGMDDGDLVAAVTGIAGRIAELELLCYPPDDSPDSGLLGSIKSTIGGALGLGGVNTADKVPKKEVPILLFCWGPGRIVPVRITTFSVEELQYMPTLYPYRAKVSITLQVLTEDNLQNVAADTANGKVVELARFCYRYTQKQKKVLAGSIPSIVGKALGALPF